MKKWGYHCIMLLYVCMGTAGILLAITNAFQLKYQKAEVFSITLLLYLLRGGNSAGVIVVYQKKRAGNS